jgi:hypothetical protein
MLVGKKIINDYFDDQAHFIACHQNDPHNFDEVVSLEED